MSKPEEVRENVPLAPYVAYRVGGPARYYLETAQEETLREAVLWALGEGLPLFVLGSGSNVLIADEGLPGLTVRWVAEGIALEGERVRVEGGTSLQEVVEWSLEEGWGGLEWAMGLPGTVGAAVRGNVGAFGGEMAQVVEEAEVMLLQKDCPLERWKREELAFEYRGSRVKQEGGIVLRAWLRLTPLTGEALAEARRIAARNLAYRRTRHPLEFPNCGSVFKNLTSPEEVQRVLRYHPEWRSRVEGEWRGKVPAAALIEAVGMKGLRLGGAQISEKHANFIINRGWATADDISTLIRLVQRVVEEQYGLRLTPEVQLLGFPSHLRTARSTR